MVEVQFVQETKDILDNVLQQNLLSFEVTPVLLKGPADDLYGEDYRSLPLGKLLLAPEGVFLGSREGQNALDFSWERKFRKWLKEAPGHPLFKALGAKRGDLVVDCTAGFGNDTCLLLAGGLNLIAYERNPLIFTALLLSQKKEKFLEERLSLNFGSLVENPKELPLYFDPMFDDGKKRKAKPSKEMEVFHYIIGADLDLIEEAKRLKQLTNRFVIKRSPRDEPLLKKVNAQWESKALRLDLYL